MNWNGDHHTIIPLQFHTKPIAPLSLIRLVPSLRLRNQQQLISFVNPLTKSTMTKYVATGVQFSFASPDEIARMASVDVTSSGTKSGHDTFTDTRFGSTNENECPDCRNSFKTCSGHWGVLDLGFPVPNPFATDTIKEILQCFCIACSTLLYEKDRIELNDVHKLVGEDRLTKIAKILAASNGTFCCPNPKCRTPVNEIIRVEERFKLRYSDGGAKAKKKDGKTVDLEYEQIYSMFKNICGQDMQILGFNESLVNDPRFTDESTFVNGMMRHRHETRPENFFITKMPIMPYPNRVGGKKGKEIKHAGYTITCQVIFKAVNALRNAKDEKAVRTARDKIQKEMFTLLKNKADDGMGTKSIASLISGKEGDVRGGCESKRADYGGRTVIGNAPDLKFGQVMLPQKMQKISQAERVCNYNIHKWNKQLKVDKQLSELASKNYGNFRKSRMIHLTITPMIEYDPVIQFITRDGQKKSFRFFDSVKNGDIIHRKLKNGDYVCMNRNPSIRKESINAHQVFICPDPSIKTVSIPNSTCKAYNADFDGDEMNVTVPQGPKCQAEMQEVFSIETRVMTDQTSRQIIGLIQGVVYAFYLMSRDDTMVKRTIFNDLVLYAEAEHTWQDTLVRAGIAKNAKSIPGKVVYSLLLPAYYSTKIGVKYDAKNKLVEGVEIYNGILIAGQLDSKSLNRVTEELYVEFSHEAAIRYINGANQVARWWNNIYGFTFGIRDCLNTRQDEIDSTLEQMIADIDNINSLPIRDVEKKAKTREKLEKAIQIGQTIARDGMYGGKNNAMSVATLSGAKGSYTNLAYISCFLGLQTVDGKEYEPELCDGNRMLPCFPMKDRSVRSRGFIMSCFKNGLSPVELFLHAWSSRKGLIDTAKTTQTSGYTQRRLGKKMENMHIDMMGCVRDCDGSIVAFSYGEMGFDPNEVFWTGGYTFFADLAAMVERINLEWKMTNGVSPEMTRSGDSLSKLEMTPFGDKQFAFIEKHLLLVGIETEPIQATRARIMYLIKKQLSGVKIIVNKWCIEEFFGRMRAAFNRSRIQPGSMVGFKATCAIGSVSTQDALNAFHFSGTSSKTTTSGLPRQTELTNLSKTPKHTGGSFRFVLEGDESSDVLNNPDAERAEKMMAIEQLRKTFEYKTLGDLVICSEILKTDKDSLTNEAEREIGTHGVFVKPKWFDLFFQCVDEDVPEFEQDFIIECKFDRKAMFRCQVSLGDLVDIAERIDGVKCVVPSPLDLDTLYIYANYDDVDLPKGIDGTIDSWKYLWTREYFYPSVLATRVCGIKGITEIFYAQENIIDYQGNNFGVLMKTPGVVFSSLKTDYVWEIAHHLGVHAAYIFLYEELSNCLSTQLNPSHIMVLARTMSNEGSLTNVTRNGISDRVGVLTKASFEMPMDTFVRAGTWGMKDTNKSVASSYFLNTLGNYGAGYGNVALVNRKVLSR